MSGTKPGEMEDRVAAMAELLRRAAEAARQAEERRHEELRRAAEKRFLETSATLEQQWQAHCDAGYGALASYALEELSQQRSGMASLQAGDIDQRRQTVEERDALISHAVKTLEQLGEQGRAGAMAALPSIRSDGDLRGAITETLAAGSAVEVYLAIQKRARDELQFVNACEVAQIPLDGEVAGAKAEVERFLAKPTLTETARAERAIALLRPTHLEEGLRARRQGVLQVLDELGQSGRRPLLEAWREGFADALTALRASVAKGDWQAAAPALRELDRFLDTRAEGRVRMMMEAAGAAGFKVAEPQKQGSRWTTSVSDKKSQLFAISETIPQWQRGGGLDATLEFHGPQNYDGPACVTAGLGQITEQLRKQGVSLRIFDEKKRELKLAVSPAPVERKPVTAQRQPPKLQQ